VCNERKELTMAKRERKELTMAKRERKEERTNNDLQNTTQGAKDRAQKIGVELRPDCL
jgi:hypothetical protein